MPPRARITKELVLDAAFRVARSQGHETITARSVAKALGSSTQPVLYYFDTVDEVREAAYNKTDEYHTAYILPKASDKDPLLTLGLNYVRFGYEEPHLFRFLFQSNRFAGRDFETLLAMPELTPMISIVAEQMGTDMERAKDLFLHFLSSPMGWRACTPTTPSPMTRKRTPSCSS